MRPSARAPATLTIEEAAELLGISRSLAYEAARSGELPTLKLGRRILVPREQLYALLGMRRHEGSNE